MQWWGCKPCAAASKESGEKQQQQQQQQPQQLVFLHAPVYRKSQTVPAAATAGYGRGTRHAAERSLCAPAAAGVNGANQTQQYVCPHAGARRLQSKATRGWSMWSPTTTWTPPHRGNTKALTSMRRSYCREGVTSRSRTKTSNKLHGRHALQHALVGHL